MMVLIGFGLIIGGLWFVKDGAQNHDIRVVLGILMAGIGAGILNVM